MWYHSFVASEDIFFGKRTLSSVGNSSNIREGRANEKPERHKNGGKLDEGFRG
jgi:hypothetical protein